MTVTVCTILFALVHFWETVWYGSWTSPFPDSLFALSFLVICWCQGGCQESRVAWHLSCELQSTEIAWSATVFLCCWTLGLRVQGLTCMDVVIAGPFTCFWSKNTVFFFTDFGPWCAWCGVFLFFFCFFFGVFVPRRSTHTARVVHEVDFFHFFWPFLVTFFFIYHCAELLLVFFVSLHLPQFVLPPYLRFAVWLKEDVKGAAWASQHFNGHTVLG